MWKLQSNKWQHERERGGGGEGEEGERESAQTKQAATTAKVLMCSEAGSAILLS